MKITKYIIASLLAINTDFAVDAKVTGPFLKKPEVMALVKKIQTNQGELKTQQAGKEKLQGKIDALGLKDDEVATKKEECTSNGFEVAYSRRLSYSIQLEGDEDKGKKTDEEKKAEEEKKKKEEEKKKKEEEQKKKEEEAKAALEQECKDLKDKLKQKKDLTKEIEPFQAKIDELTPKIAQDKASLKELNPGFNPPTLDTIKQSLSADGKFDFLITEVDESSNLELFTQFKTKLDKETTNWETMKGTDQGKVDEGGDKAALYEKRVKADDMAIKTVKDLNTKIKTISDAWETDATEMTDDQKSTLKVAIAQYQHDAVASNIMQAMTLMPLDSAKEAAFGQYVKDMKEVLGEKQKNLETETKKASEGTGNMMLYVTIGAVAAFTIFGAIALFKFCKTKKED